MAILVPQGPKWCVQMTHFVQQTVQNPKTYNYCDGKLRKTVSLTHCRNEKEEVLLKKGCVVGLFVFPHVSHTIKFKITTSDQKARVKILKAEGHRDI